MTTEILMAGFGGRNTVCDQTACQSGARRRPAGDMDTVLRAGGARRHQQLQRDNLRRAHRFPIVTRPDVLLALNLQSFDKFVPRIKPGGTLIYDSSLVHKTTERTDIAVHEIRGRRLRPTTDCKAPRTS